MDLHALIRSKDYDFLRDHPRLGERIMILGPGGSYAYGTNNENSDIDIRGITLNTPSDLLGLTEFEQYEDRGTDTVIYSFNKMVRLLLECNPNTCEILGLDGEDAGETADSDGIGGGGGGYTDNGCYGRADHAADKGEAVF